MVCREEKSKSLAERVEQLRAEWKRLWDERLDDEVRAESIAKDDYSSLSIERGTVILATRNFKPMTFTGVLKEQGIGEIQRFVSPSPSVGGWGTFIKKQVLCSNSRNRGRQSGYWFSVNEKKPQQLKKSGKGWLHVK